MRAVRTFLTYLAPQHALHRMLAHVALGVPSPWLLPNFLPCQSDALPSYHSSLPASPHSNPNLTRQRSTIAPEPALTLLQSAPGTTTPSTPSTPRKLTGHPTAQATR
jgi:hypothetical protein